MANASALPRLEALLQLRTLIGADLVTRRPRRPIPLADWSRLIDLADELMVTPALWSQLQNHPKPLPAEITERVRESHLGNTVRNLRFKRSLIAAISALNQVGITPLLFKGSLALVDGTLPRLGDRVMVDLDILIPAQTMNGAGGALGEIGWKPYPGKPFLHPHELPFVLTSAPGPIELHTELGSEPIPTALPAAAAWAASTEISVDGARVRALSPTHQVLHNVLHAAVQDLNHAVGGLPLRQLLALSQLASAHGLAIDWPGIRRTMEKLGLGDALRDHLWLAHRYAGLALPGGDWGWRGGRASLHEARVLINFALGWPAHVHRNLHYAFGRAYLDSLYAHGDRPLHLASARLRHGAKLLRQSRRGALRDALERKM